MNEEDKAKEWQKYKEESVALAKANLKRAGQDMPPRPDGPGAADFGRALESACALLNAAESHQRLLDKLNALEWETSPPNVLALVLAAITQMSRWTDDPDEVLVLVGGAVKAAFEEKQRARAQAAERENTINAIQRRVLAAMTKGQRPC